MNIRKYVTINPFKWNQYSHKIAAFIRKSGKGADETVSNGEIGILIIPWLGTIVPFFSVVAGLLFCRYGCKVTYIVDDIPFGTNLIRYRIIMYFINKVVSSIGLNFQVLRLSNSLSKNAVPLEVVDRIAILVRLNAVHALRGETIAEGRQEYSQVIGAQLTLAYQAIDPFLKGHRFNILMFPGGVYGSTGIWKLCCEKQGVRVATYDSGGFGTLMLAANGIAAQLQDIPVAFKMLKERNSFKAELSFCLTEAKSEISRRRAGIDTFVSQIATTSQFSRDFEDGILIALNSSWDQAALGLHTVFEDSHQWLIQTIEFLLHNTDKPVVVRQHPVERLEIASTTDDYRAMLEKNFSGNDQVIFIAASDPVNTYEVLKKVSTVVVYSSTVGVESAADGKIVITPSSNYYSSLGFVWQSSSREEYFSQLRKAANGTLAVTEQMKEDALLCYYITQCCNWLFTDFNTENIEVWKNLTLDQLYQQETVQLMLECVADNIPIAYLNHLHKLQYFAKR